MKKSKCHLLHDLWAMRKLSLKQLGEAMSKHPHLKFLIKAAGATWLIRTVIAFLISANIIYYLIRILEVCLN